MDMGNLPFHPAIGGHLTLVPGRVYWALELVLDGSSPIYIHLYGKFM